MTTRRSSQKVLEGRRFLVQSRTRSSDGESRPRRSAGSHTGGVRGGGPGRSRDGALRAGTFALFLALLSSCSVPPSPVEPRAADRTLPDSFAGSEEGESSTPVAWDEFFEPPLCALIETALRNNQELNILTLEMGIAKNEIMARRGEYLPKLDVAVGAGIERVGESTSQGAADEANDVPVHLEDYVVGFFTSWEVDVWRKLRNATDAATLRYLASLEGRKFAVTRLVAEIASSYYELLALDNRLRVLKQNIEIQSDALKVVRLQKQAARVTELAVKRFEAEVLKNRSRQYAIQQQLIETENRINFLLGRLPQPVMRESADFIERVPSPVHEGLPSQLLENRPDVRQAEFELAAAKLDVEVARASFYPSLGIRAGVGYNAYGLTQLTDTPESLFYTLAADLSAPILNRKAIEAAYFSANAVQMQAVHGYERAILSAFREVTNQLTMIENLDESFELRSQEVARLNQSITISSGLFTSARADYMEVLLTRRDALDAQMELIETKQRRMTAMVNLYQALGGGWRGTEESLPRS